MKFLTDFTYRNLHGFARFPGDSTALVRLTAPNSISAWAVPQTLLGELTLLPRPNAMAVFKGPVSKGIERKGEKIGSEEGKNGGRGP